jgi:hypothetical protein
VFSLTGSGYTNMNGHKREVCKDMVTGWESEFNVEVRETLLYLHVATVLNNF